MVRKKFLYDSAFLKLGVTSYISLLADSLELRDRELL